MSTKDEVIGKYEPATGPWRTDVENAPMDVQLLCWQWTPVNCDWHCIGMKKVEDGRWECGIGDCVHDDPIAFAVIHPPNATAPEAGAGEQG